MIWLKKNKPLLTILALILADMLGTVLVILPISIAIDGREFFDRNIQDQFASVAGMLLVIAVVGAVVWLFVGVPVHLLLLDKRLTKLWNYVWPAALAGAIAGAIYVPLFPITATAGFLLGISNSLIFWLIRRPDKDVTA